MDDAAGCRGVKEAKEICCADNTARFCILRPVVCNGWVWTQTLAKNNRVDNSKDNWVSVSGTSHVSMNLEDEEEMDGFYTSNSSGFGVKASVTEFRLPTRARGTPRNYAAA